MHLSKNKGDQKGRKTLPDKGKTGKSLRRKATGPDNPTGVDGSQLPKKVTYRQDPENECTCLSETAIRYECSFFAFKQKNPERRSR